MAYFYVSWARLEPKRGEYAFAEWERHWNNPKAKGKHIIFRLYLDYPGLPCGVPQWVIDSGVKLTPYEKLAPDIPKGLHPDYADPRLLEPLLEFITALGRRYNKSPRIAFIALGTLGFWGEWHNWPKEGWFPGRDIQQKVMDAYRHAFPDKILLARYPADRVTAEAPGLGYHDDLFPEDSDGPEAWKFLPMLRRGKRMENWRRAAIGGELVPNQAAKWLGEGWERTRAMAEALHLSWIGPYCPANEPRLTSLQRQRAEQLVRLMGYQFRLTKLTHTSKRLTLEGVNEGVAPFYYPWPVELAAIDSVGRVVKTVPIPVDLRTWLPGAFSFSTELPLVQASRWAIGIRDPGGQLPVIRFANALPVVNGWTLLQES